MNNDMTLTRPSDGQTSAKGIRNVQLLKAGSLQFGIFADEIAAIEEWREPIPLPYAPKSVLGVVSIQGRMLTVLDLAALPVRDAISTDSTSEQLIALRGDEQLALAVDTVGETIAFTETDFDNNRETGEPLVLAVLSQEGRDIQILNLKELFPTAIQGRERRRRRF
jgi:chemotaxis signal transduction protein